MKKRVYLAGFILMMGQLSQIFADTGLYTLQDLQALDQRKAYDELIVHLQDLPPKLRGAEWNTLVEHACLQPGKRSSDQVQYCMPMVKSVLDSQPEDNGFAWKAGKWAIRNAASWTSVPYFAKAITTAGDPRCTDEDLLLGVVSGLDLPDDNNHEVLVQAQTLAFNLCWPATREAILNGLDDSAGYYRANTCSQLKEKKALSKLEIKECSKP